MKRAEIAAQLLTVLSLAACSGEPVDLSQYPPLGQDATRPDLEALVPFQATFRSGSEQVRWVLAPGAPGTGELEFSSTLQFSDGREFVDAITFSTESGLPVRGVSPTQGGAAAVELEYAGPRVSGSLNAPGSPPEPFECHAEADIASGVGLAVVLATLPLDVGYRVRVPILRRSDCTTVWVPFEVLGTERLELPDGSAVDAWVVDGHVFGTYWLSSRPPYGLRRDLRGGAGQQLLESFSIE